MAGLCAVCTGCIRDHSGSKWDIDESPQAFASFEAHKTVESLISSAKASCVICRLLWGSISPSGAALLEGFTPSESVFTSISIGRKPPSFITPGMSEDVWGLSAHVECYPMDWTGPTAGVAFVLEPEQGMHT